MLKQKKKENKKEKTKLEKEETISFRTFAYPNFELFIMVYGGYVVV